MSDKGETKDISVRIAYWRDWIQGDIAEQVRGIWFKRRAFESWNDIVGFAQLDSSFFVEWVNENYLRSLAMVVRSMCDKNKRTRSLYLLLNNIKDEAHILTREWWISRYPDSINTEYHYDMYKRYLRAFDNISYEGVHLDPKIVYQDIQELDKMSDKVRPYANKYVAHLDKDRQKFGLAMGSLHSAADKLYEIFHRWHDFLCKVNSSVPSVRQWENDFTKPWITREQAGKIVSRRRAEATELGEHLSRQALGRVDFPDHQPFF